MSPLRGLDPFGEAERDVWSGRETERDDVAKMVTADGFRAGLVFGEPGVGKTSLVRAGLIPHLRDKGIVALACDDLNLPSASVAAGLSAFGIQPNAGEQPAAFVTRAVSNAVAGQLFVFVIDDADILCADERAANELADLFTKVVGRSGGRARFVFVAASERLHALGILEKRTGSLFPPSTRYELHRLAQSNASHILDRVLALSGVAADPSLAEAVVQGIGRGGALLPADLQIAAMAMRDLRISSAGALQAAGGPTELESAWLHAAANATGNERSALRMCAELAIGTGPRPAEHVIRRMNLEPGFANNAFTVLENRGVIVRADQQGNAWMLRHEVLTSRVRELTAPARASARRAFDLLGSKAATSQRLSLAELRALRSEGIAPVTPEERAVVDRSKRHYLMIAGGIAAVPIVIMLIILLANKGRAHFALEPRAGGDHVVVRSGRASVSFPGYGGTFADTGLTRSMVAPEMWKKVESKDLGASRGSWDDLLPQLMSPQLAGLVEYATGNDAPLEGLKKAAKDPDDLAELLAALRPIARGSQGEAQLLAEALKTQPPSPPAVQRAAVATAGAAAQRRDVYQDLLVDALISSDAELRRIAFASVRSLGERGRALFNAALAKDPDAAAKRELLVEVSASSSDEAPSVDRAVAVLSDPEASAPLKDRARTQIKLALAQPDPTAAATALANLLAADKAPVESRLFAIEALFELDPLPKAANLSDAVHAAYDGHNANVRIAVLPLYARVDPERATNEVEPMLDKKPPPDKPTRIAAALAWGEIAAKNKDAATQALEKFYKDPDDDVRAAAAAASGKVGRAFQDRLFKMAKIDNYNVRIGAAEGLAASAEVGANAGIAVDGIGQLWTEKGRARREAVRIYARLAKKKPAAVMYYLEAAAHNPEDTALHVLGVEGLCNAALAGSLDARRALPRSTDDPLVDVRRILMQCVANGPDPAKNGAAIALKLATDVDNSIRADAARVLALAATTHDHKVGPGISEALVKLLDDPDRDVRLIAIRAVGGLGSDAPKSAQTAMSRMFERGDEGEKLALLRAGNQIGAADLVGFAIADASPDVRVAAVDAALASGLRASATLSAALADTDPQVRKAALERLAAQKDKVDPAVLDRALSLAARDPDPELSQLALTTIARVTPKKEAVVDRLHRSLSSRVERERAQAAAAAIGLVDRDAALAVQLLEPLLDDPSHDVRVAMLPALAAAYAKLNDLQKLADLMRDSEDNSMRRLIVAGALFSLASTDNGRAKAGPILKDLVDSGPPMAAAMAKLVLGLANGKADGIAFLQELVP